MKTRHEMARKKKAAARASNTTEKEMVEPMPDEDWSVKVNGPNGGTEGNPTTHIWCNECNHSENRTRLGKRDQRELKKVLAILTAAVAAVEDSLAGRKKRKYPDVAIITRE